MLADMCQACIHLMKMHIDKESGKFTGRCMAFPGGIPRELFLGETPHDTVIDGQSGDYVFSPVSPETYNEHFKNY